MYEIGKFITEIGFPIFVALFVLIRIEPVLRKMDLTLRGLLEFLKAKDN